MQKIKSLMTRQGLKSPQESMADLSPVENFRIPSKEELRELREQPIDPQAEQEIIDSIEEVYFSNDAFDMVQHELENLFAVYQITSYFGTNQSSDLVEELSIYIKELSVHRQRSTSALKMLFKMFKGIYHSDFRRETLGTAARCNTPSTRFDAHSFAPIFHISSLIKAVLRAKPLKVSKKVADLILEKQPAYVKELERVTALQTNLQLAAVICTNARRQLGVAKEGFTGASLGLLANQRRRHLLTGLLKSLRTIKTLQRTDVRLSEMLEEEDYPGAIQLCLECQKAASTFKHYSCISELNSKLQDTLEQIEEQLDVALSKTCKHFDVAHYTKVQLAYTLLGKTQTAMDQLHMHFTQAIHNTVFQVVLGYVELCAGNADTKFQKMQYKDLCTHITLDSYIPCLTDLCKALWEVMLSYHRTMQWHEEHDNMESSPGPDDAAAAKSGDSVVDRSYVKKKLEHGLTRIWQDVQLKVKAYILGTDMSNFKYDDFIVVLDVISRLMQVGEEFCGSKSEVLQESIKWQSVNYFKHYHRVAEAALLLQLGGLTLAFRHDGSNTGPDWKELRMFLENETWELCPVKSNFNIAQLHEFKFMGQCRSPSVSPSRQAASSTGLAQEELSLFQLYLLEGNPFEMHIEHKEEETEDVLASNGYESDELEKCVYQDYDNDSDSDVPRSSSRTMLTSRRATPPSRVYPGKPSEARKSQTTT
ncbi:hypothetical protein fugu_018384 [Takifugu bimaculatus]|uniref:Vacuolar protein sorting-associated protein 54 N-terminal domain-containing protein n=1 Tax=Takifugu bimaculatus TaxID=433685 RepID=A0A4Z2BM09_9TELE|nr:hypothetical protein fugu_018384 [Takifugu bimaculatus]